MLGCDLVLFCSRTNPERLPILFQLLYFFLSLLDSLLGLSLDLL